MEADEKFEACEKVKAEGNELFKNGKFERASKKYKKAVGYIDSDYSMTDEQKAKAKTLKSPCYLNLAACKLKSKQWKDAIENCNKALEQEPNNAKALFRRGQAYNELDEWESSKNDLTLALKNAPKSAEIKKELDKLQRKIKSHNDREKKRFKNMFQRMSALEEKEIKEKQEEAAQNETKKEVPVEKELPVDENAAEETKESDSMEVDPNST